MSSIYKIEIEPLCKHHSLPFVYICTTKYCICQARLCEKCLTQHETDNQNSNIMKIDNFVSKIGTEVDIVNRQLDKLEASSNKPSATLKETQDKVNKFLLNQIKVMEDSMKHLNEEAYKVRQELKDSSEVLTLKMANVEIKRNAFPQKYCRKVIDTKILDTMIMFYSQEGFANFRKKLDKSLKVRTIVKDFLQEVDKYGTKYEQFMKSSSFTVANQLSMKSSMKEILKIKKVQENANIEGGLQFKRPERENKLIKEGDANEPRRDRRAKTIFGK